jgi:sec-independent protein translocase protein TatB
VFNLGMGEITVILLLALIFLGPKKLPELAAGLGKLIREIRKATSDVKNEIALDDTFRKPFEELRDAVTLHPDELKRRDKIRQEIEETRRRAEEEARAAEARAAEAAAAEAPAGTNGAGAPVADAAAHPSAHTTVVPPPPIDATVIPHPLRPTPPGTVAHRETLRRMPPSTGTPAGGIHAGPPPPPVVSAGARITPPISSASGERANTTQFLTEKDLIPSEPPKPPPTPKKT